MIVYENKTTFGTYRGPSGNPAPPHVDDPVSPEGTGWYQVGATIATIDGLLIWTWQRSFDTDTPSEIERLRTALKAANDRADAAEHKLRRYEGGSYAGMLDRT